MKNFHDSALDSFLLRWLLHTLNAAELAEAKEQLKRDANFRSQLCNWIQSLREPAWMATAANEKGRRKFQLRR